MKKISITLAGILLAFASVGVAHADTFNVSLGRNSTQVAEVMRLQQFLYDNGYLSVQPTGAFLSMTLKAVAAFQRDNGIEMTGYFGPLTRAAANTLLALRGNSSEGGASTIATLSVFTNNTPSAVAAVLSGISAQKTITWQTVNYPKNVGVNINLLRKISDSPRTLVLVRRIAIETPNDGQEVWLPQVGETGDNLYVEVTCSRTYQFRAGCHFSSDPVKVN
jgi:hypothetical protein